MASQASLTTRSIRLRSIGSSSQNSSMRRTGSGTALWKESFSSTDSLRDQSNPDTSKETKGTYREPQDFISFVLHNMEACPVREGNLTPSARSDSGSSGKENAIDMREYVKASPKVKSNPSSLNGNRRKDVNKVSGRGAFQPVKRSQLNSLDRRASASNSNVEKAPKKSFLVENASVNPPEEDPTSSRLSPTSVVDPNGPGMLGSFDSPDQHPEASHSSNFVTVPTKEIQFIQKSHSLEVVKLQKALDTALSQRSKTIENLKKKKELLAKSESDRADLAKRLEESLQKIEQLEEDKSSLTLGVQKLSATKDMLKFKLKTKDEILKDAREERDNMARRLRKCERDRAMERELMENYRELGRHTGYYGWGKTIRKLETELSTDIANNRGFE